MIFLLCNLTTICLFFFRNQFKRRNVFRFILPHRYLQKKGKLYKNRYKKNTMCLKHYLRPQFLFFFFQENISISRKQFKDSVTELNPFVSPVGLHAIIYEYTWWMDPSNKSALIDAIDKMVGDYQFTCPVQEFAQRYGKKRLWGCPKF